ncbi:MAG: restriction endonuclease [Dehalococcoidia bacterium]
MTRAILLLGVISAAVSYFDSGGYRWAGALTLAIAAVLAVLRVRSLLRHHAERRTLHGLRKLPPHEFEQEVGRWLRRDGWRVEHRGGTGDAGIDLVARRQGESVAVQCKRYAETAAVSAAQVRELYGSAMAISATGAVLVTTGRISAPAVAWAEALPPELPLALLDAEAIAPVAARHAHISSRWR